MRRTTSMKIVCAWCGKTLQDEEGTSFLISHGICVHCAVKAKLRNRLLVRWRHRPLGQLEKILRRASRRSRRK